MRDVLTGLAIILIVALTTALVAPYLVDWNSQRGFLEARLSHTLGQKVTIGGNIDLKLLPTPYLVLDQTVIGGDEGAIAMGIRHLDLELSVTPLLHGEFDIVEARLREPTLRMTLQPDRSLPALPNVPAFQANLRFDRIEVSNGTIAVADPQSGRTLVLDHLDFTADSPAIVGPFKGSGAAGDADARTKFRFATTAAQKGHSRAHLVVEETSTHAGLDLDGLVTLAPADTGSVEPGFEGTMVLSSHLLDAQDDLVAWTLTGPLRADPRQAVVEGAEIRIGREDAGLTLQADGRADFGSDPKLFLVLSGKQLDIDRLSGAPIDSTKPAPPRLPDLATIRHWLGGTPSMPADVNVKVDTATYGGETLSNLAAHLSLGGPGPQALRLEGDGPGGSNLVIDGKLSAEMQRFEGDVVFGAENLPAMVAWAASIDPDVSAHAAGVPFGVVKATGHVVATAGGIAATGLALTLDRSDFTGTASLTYGAGGAPAKLAADIEAKALDLEALPDLDTWRETAAPFDLDIKLDAQAINVSRLGDGRLAAGHLRLALAKTGRHAALTQLRADDFGGATIDATASIDPDKATLAATLAADKLGATADLVRRLAPGHLADALAARAPALAPAKLKVDATFAPNGRGGLDAVRLDLDGHLAATTIGAHLSSDPEQAGALALTASADAPEGALLLAQLGFETLPLDLLGRSRLAVTAHGPPGQPLATTIDGSFGATRLVSEGRFDWLGGEDGSGTIAVKSGDIGPLLQSLALAFPDMTGRIPLDVTGRVAVAPAGGTLTDLKGDLDGVAMGGTLKWQSANAGQPVLTGAFDLDRLRLAGLLGLSLGPAQPAGADSLFSNVPFNAGLVDPPRGALRLRAKILELGAGLVATEASFDLGIAPNLVTLRQLKARLDGGGLAADLTLRRDGDQAAVEGKIRADGVTIDLPSLKTKLTANLDVAGSGISSLALVSSLAGNGDATMRQLRIPGADPAPLPHIFDAVEGDDLSVDGESIVRALEEAVKGPLDAGDRHVRLGLAAGTLHLEAVGAPPSGPVTSAIDTTFDLRRGRIDATVTQTLQALPKGWTGAPPSIAILWSGPLQAPKRSFDVANFLNAVAARALARETARLEAYELDIRERAFFNARLQSDHRREEDRLKAEDEARKAEAARLAAKKAADDKAATDKANRDRAFQDLLRSSGPPERGSAPSPTSPSDGEMRRFEAPPVGATSDPSAAGRY